MGEGAPTADNEEARNSPEYVAATVVMRDLSTTIRNDFTKEGPLHTASWRRRDSASIHVTVVDKAGVLKMHEGHSPANKEGSRGNDEFTYDFTLNDFGGVDTENVTVQRGREGNVPSSIIDESDLIFLTDLAQAYYEREQDDTHL